MKLFVSYKDFLKNPLVAILFLAVMSLGYLYLDNKGVYEDNILRLEEDIRIIKQEHKELKEDYKKLNATLIATIKEINKPPE